MQNSRLQVAIIGARAYTAGELLRIATRHSGIEVRALMAREGVGPVADVFPWARGLGFPDITPLDIAALPEGIAGAFLCLPHTVAAQYAQALLDRGIRVFDLSSDFRFRDHRVYEKTYGVIHPAPELNRSAVYGLPEINRANIRGARLVACPGCYPTSVTLALAPLMKHDLIETESLIADCKSGVSGAGRQPSDTTHYVAVNENFHAYKVAEHRHQPEIEEQLSRLAGRDVPITFVPHLLPMERGIFATCYVSLKEATREEAIRNIYAQFYRNEPFVRLLPAGTLPATASVARGNFADVQVRVDPRGRRLIAMCAIDNLVKGASGQAMQCFNASFGLLETAGLI